MFVLGNRRQLNVVSCAPAYPRATAMAGWIKDQEVGIRCRRDMLDQGKGRLRRVGGGGWVEVWTTKRRTLPPSLLVFSKERLSFLS